MNRFARFIVLALGLMSTSIALAEDTCKVITVSWQYLECVEADRKAADAKLNASYKKLIARFASQREEDPAQAEAFIAIARDSQRAWLKLRDTTCLLEATEVQPGSQAQSLMISLCVARISLERAGYLEAIASDRPSDVINISQVSESASRRFGDVVARYVSTFGNPCLTVQTLAPDGNWRVLSSRQFCTFDGKRFWSDYAEAGFEDHAFAEDGLHVTLSLTELRAPGEKRLACVIPIQNAQIQELKCGAPESS